ncbi:MAG: hypothetical protein V3U16_04040, partial [Candidatus Neomarinimicrobiota bacterium]
VLCTLNAQQTPVFEELTIDSKMNGAFITLFSTTPVLEQNVTGWHTETGWFYITILNAVTDTTRIGNEELTDPISKIEITNYPESTQLAFKIENEVESFDIYTSDAPAGLLISIRFPLEEVIAALEQEKEEMVLNETEAVALNDIEGQKLYRRLRAAMYLTGTSLAISGALMEDSEHVNAPNWEIPAGIGLVALTYLYDRFIHSDRDEQ